MKTYKVTARTSRGKKIRFSEGVTPHAALRKVQRPPAGHHWEECSYKDRENYTGWVASVRTDDEFHSFIIRDNG